MVGQELSEGCARLFVGQISTISLSTYNFPRQVKLYAIYNRVRCILKPVVSSGPLASGSGWTVPMPQAVLHSVTALWVSPRASHLSPSSGAPGPSGGGQCAAAVRISLPRWCLFGRDVATPRPSASRFPPLPMGSEGDTERLKGALTALRPLSGRAAAYFHLE